MDIPKRVSHDAAQPHPETGSNPHPEAELNQQHPLTGAHQEHPNPAAHYELGSIHTAVEAVHDQPIGAPASDINLCSLTTGGVAASIPLLQENTADSKLPGLEVGSTGVKKPVGESPLATDAASALSASVLSASLSTAPLVGSSMPDAGNVGDKLAALGTAATLTVPASNIEAVPSPAVPLSTAPQLSASSDLTPLAPSPAVASTNLESALLVPPSSIISASLDSAPLNAPPPVTEKSGTPSLVSLHNASQALANAEAKLAALGGTVHLTVPPIIETPAIPGVTPPAKLQPGSILTASLEPTPLPAPVITEVPVVSGAGVPTKPQPGSILTAGLDSTTLGKTTPDVANTTAKLDSLGGTAPLTAPVITEVPPVLASGAPAKLQPGSILTASLESAPPLAPTPVGLSSIVNQPIDVAAATAKLDSLGALAPLTAPVITEAPPVLASGAPAKLQPGSILTATLESAPPLAPTPVVLSPIVNQTVDVAAATAKLDSLGGSAPLTAPVITEAPPVLASGAPSKLQPGSILTASLEPAPLAPTPVVLSPTLNQTVDVAAATAKLDSLGSSAPLTAPVITEVPTLPASGVPAKTQPGSILTASLESAPPLAPTPVVLSSIVNQPIDVAAATAKFDSLGGMAPLTAPVLTEVPPVLASGAPTKLQPGSILTASLESSPPLAPTPVALSPTLNQTVDVAAATAKLDSLGGMAPLTAPVITEVPPVLASGAPDKLQPGSILTASLEPAPLQTPAPVGLSSIINQPIDVAAATAKLDSLGGSAPLTAPVITEAPPVLASGAPSKLQPGSILTASLEPAPLAPTPVVLSPTLNQTVDVAAATAKLDSLGSSAPLTAPVITEVPTLPASGVPAKTQPGSILTASLESAPPLAPTPVVLSSIVNQPIDVAAATAKFDSLGGMAPLTAPVLTEVPPVLASGAPDKLQPGSILTASLESSPPLAPTPVALSPALNQTVDVAAATAKLDSLGGMAPLTAPVLTEVPPVLASGAPTKLQPGSILTASLESSPPLAPTPVALSPTLNQTVDVAAATAKFDSLGGMAPLTAPVLTEVPPVLASGAPTKLQPGSILTASLESSPPLAPTPVVLSSIVNQPIDLAAATAKFDSLGGMAPLTAPILTEVPPVLASGAPTQIQPGSILTASLDSAPPALTPISNPTAEVPGAATTLAALGDSVPLAVPAMMQRELETVPTMRSPEVVAHRPEEQIIHTKVQIASSEQSVIEPVRHLVGAGSRAEDKAESAPPAAYSVRFGSSKMLAKDESNAPIDQIRAVRLLTSDATSATATPGNVSAYVLGQLLARQASGAGVGSTAAAALGQLLSTQSDSTAIAATTNKQASVSSGSVDVADVRGRLVGAAPIDAPNPQNKGVAPQPERDIEAEGKSKQDITNTKRTSRDELIWETEETRRIQEGRGELVVGGKRTGGKTTTDTEDEEDERIDDIEAKARGFGGGGSKSNSQNGNNDPNNPTGQQHNTTDPNHTNTGTANPNQKNDDDLDYGQLSELVRELRGRPQGTTPTTRRPDRTTEPQGMRFEKRRRYKIRLGDTLESIARRELGNVKAAPLILRMNRATLTSGTEGAVVLKPGTYIILPSHGECLRYLAEQALAQDAKLIFCAQPDSTSSKPTYVCRFGETLISIARRHEQLRDTRFWVLLARINNLSENTDRAGEPIAKLKRGQRLLLPTEDQKAVFLRQLTQKIQDAIADDDAPVYVQPPGTPNVPARAPEAQPINPTIKPVTPDGVISPPSGHTAPSGIPHKQPNPDAGVSPPSGHTAQSGAPYKQPSPEAQPHTKPVDRTVVTPQTVRTVVSANQAQNGDTESHTQPAGTPDAATHNPGNDKRPSVYVQPPKKQGAQNGSLIMPPLFPSDTPKNYETRVVSQGDLGDSADNLRLELELKIGDSWTPVVQYRVRDGHSSVSAYTSSGRQRTLTIDLPNRAARELAENDLTANASSYCQRYLANQLPF